MKKGSSCLAAASALSVPGGHRARPGAAFASVPWILGVGSEGRKEPAAIPGPASPSHPCEAGRGEGNSPSLAIRRSGAAAGWPAEPENKNGNSWIRTEENSCERQVFCRR